MVDLEMQSVTSSEFLTWCFAKGGCSVNVCQISKIKALFLEVQFVNLKICTYESYKFCLIAPQIALRHCSKETQGEGQYTCDFGEGRIHIQSSTYFSKGFY